MTDTSELESAIMAAAEDFSAKLASVCAVEDLLYLTKGPSHA